MTMVDGKPGAFFDGRAEYFRSMSSVPEDEHAVRRLGTSQTWSEAAEVSVAIQLEDVIDSGVQALSRYVHSVFGHRLRKTSRETIEFVDEDGRVENHVVVAWLEGVSRAERIEALERILGFLADYDSRVVRERVTVDLR